MEWNESTTMYLISFNSISNRDALTFKNLAENVILIIHIRVWFISAFEQGNKFNSLKTYYTYLSFNPKVRHSIQTNVHLGHQQTPWQASQNEEASITLCIAIPTAHPYLCYTQIVYYIYFYWFMFLKPRFNHKKASKPCLLHIHSLGSVTSHHNRIHNSLYLNVWWDNGSETGWLVGSWVNINNNILWT